jgi:hypothetical protein
MLIAADFAVAAQTGVAVATVTNTQAGIQKSDTADDGGDIARD